MIHLTPEMYFEQYKVNSIAIVIAQVIGIRYDHAGWKMSEVPYRLKQFKCRFKVTIMKRISTSTWPQLCSKYW